MSGDEAGPQEISVNEIDLSSQKNNDDTFSRSKTGGELNLTVLDNPGANDLSKLLDDDSYICELPF